MFFSIISPWLGETLQRVKQVIPLIKFMIESRNSLEVIQVQSERANSMTKLLIKTIPSA